MIITMKCLTNIMDTGNKVFIVCEDYNDKMFPFHNRLQALLPIGNKNSLILLIEAIQLFYDKEINIIAPDNLEVAKIAKEYNTKLLIKQKNYIRQIYESCLNGSAIAIFKGETILHSDDVKQVLNQLEQKESSILIKENDRNTRSIDVIGVDADINVHAIYAHPREHYVNAHVCGAYVLAFKDIAYLEYCSPGFHNVNCGQMPDERYYLEEAIQNAIEDSNLFKSIWCKQKQTSLHFVWNIREANELFCNWINDLHSDCIADSASVDESCIRHGFIVVGSNTEIKDGVIFEGNCIIGKNVLIEKGAIIGNNCFIGDGSRLSHHCKIDNQSVIGSNNKIGFNAEISGVTFDGVCAVHGCEVFGIIGRKVDIAAGVQMAILRFDDMQTIQNIAGKKYSNSYTNNICIGDYCRTGVNNVFLPGVKVGCRSALGPCLMIDKDIPENSLVSVVQETKTREWGSHRYGW